MENQQLVLSDELNSEDQVLVQAGSLADLGQWKEAISLLKRVAQGRPLSAKALSQLAYYYSQDGAYDDAISLYTNLSQQQPSEGKWFYYIGFQYQQKKKWPEAIAAYEKSSDLAPRWSLPSLRLGDAYQELKEPGKALEAYRKGIKRYLDLPPNWRSDINKSTCGKLCGRTARLLLDKQNRSSDELEEAIRLCQESVTIEANDADNWYRLGCAMLEANRVDEALDHFQKGETLNPKKEYICHKIAQVYLKKGDHDRALKAYERIPEQKRSPYILHGMGQSYMTKGEPMEAARKFNQAVQREPRKFYHYWDFALALIALGAKDQAIETLEKANHLFQQEHQKDYRKAVDKLEEVKSALPPGIRVSFDKPSKNLGVTRFGVVTKYVEEKGYGFLKDDADGNRVFFHISHVNGCVVPEVGTRTRYACEVTEKGLQAAKVWLLREKGS